MPTTPCWAAFYLWPRVFSLENYKAVFRNDTVFQAYTITILRTLIGTVASVLFTAMVSYGLSKPYLIFRKAYLLIGTVTMFFGGGLIPYFLVLKSLGLINNFLVYIIPALFSFFQPADIHELLSGTARGTGGVGTDRRRQ